MRLNAFWAFVLCMLIAGAVAADQVRLPVIADTSLQAHPSEINYNSGATSGIRVKGNEHFMPMKFDLSPISGWRVARATLYIHETGPTMLRTVGLSTISADWQEGSGTGGQARDGCTFTRAVWPDTFWAGPGSDFTNVALTNGNTLVRYTDVRRQDNGWLAIDVDPLLVHAMLCGDSYGLCLTDEKGQTRANNDVHSREQSASAPYMIVEGQRAAPQTPRTPPGKVSAQAWPDAATFTTGAVRLTVVAPDAFRYEITYQPDGGDQVNLPRYLTPHPVPPGEGQSIIVPGLDPATEYTFRVAAVDAFGMVSAFPTATGLSSPAKPLPAPLQRPRRATERKVGPPSAGGLTVWACPAECKVNPINGNVLEEVGRAGYEGNPSGSWRQDNPVWDGATASLSVLRGEVATLQIVVAASGMLPARFSIRQTSAGDPDAFPQPVLLARNWYVRDGQWFAEYMLPVSEGEQIPSADNDVPVQRTQSYTIVWEVPRDITPGLKQCRIEVVGPETISIPVQVDVADIEIPAKTTFEVDLNCYGPVANDASFDEYLRWERQYYAAAHRLRSTVNPLPYSQSGKTYRGFVPPLEGEGAQMRITDWSQYDSHYGPYLDGSAFGGLRAGVPITHMYLPHHEDWPSPIAENYSAGNDLREYPGNIVKHALEAPIVEQAFSKRFQDAFVAVTRQFVEHFRQRGWADTDMQCYQNNKYYFKDEEYDFRGTSWWLLDEPMHRDDWMALRFFARMFREGRQGDPRFIYRGDISRPQWQRDWLDGLVDVMCVSSELFSSPRHCRRMVDQWGAIFWHYGTANPINQSNLSGEAWALKAYVAGADGILPWNCIGGDGALTQPTATALFVPGTRFGIQGPVVSLRLLGLCRGQQDVEYLNLLAKAKGYDRDQVARLVADFVGLDATHRQDYVDDAGTVSFDALSWQEFADLRAAVIDALGG